jgi:hypothetical protein
VTWPNGGEVLTPGQSCALTWEASDNVGVTAVDILRSWDGGATFSDTLGSGLVNSGSFPWTVPAGGSTTSRIRVIAHDAAGLAWFDDSDGDFVTGSVSHVPEMAAGMLALAGGTPNPFRLKTEIAYTLDRPGWVTLCIYGASGKQIRRLVAECQTTGRHEARWDGRTEAGEPAPAGLYFCRLAAGERELTQRLLMLR